MLNELSFKGCRKTPSFVDLLFSLQRVIKKIQYRLDKSKANARLKNQVSGRHGVAARAMAQVKVHKKDYPLRFIFSMCGSPIDNLSKYISKILWLLLKNYSRIVGQSKDIAREIRKTNMRGKKWISMDVCALYPSVPVNLIIELLCDKMNSNPDFGLNTPFTIMEIKNFLDICLNMGNYFKDCEKYGR